MTIKVVPKAACDSESQQCRYAAENRTIRAKESRNRNLMWLLEFILESESVFEEAAETLIIFLLNKAG